MDQDIKLIIKEEISLLLTAGDKIVTKNHYCPVKVDK